MKRDIEKVSPLRKRINQVMEPLVDNIEVRKYREGTKEYNVGLLIKERELAELEGQLSKEELQLLSRLEAQLKQQEEKNKGALDKTASEMEALLQEEQSVIIGLDSQLRTLEDEKATLLKRLAGLELIVKSKTESYERDLAKKETKLNLELETKLKERQQSLEQIKDDLLQLNIQHDTSVAEVHLKENVIDELERELTQLVNNISSCEKKIDFLYGEKLDVELDLERVKRVKAAEDRDYQSAKEDWQKAKVRYETEKAQREAIEAQLDKMLSSQ